MQEANSQFKPATLDLDNGLACCAGDWTVFGLGTLAPRLNTALYPVQVRGVDLAQVQRMDTGGALILQRWLAAQTQGAPVTVQGASAEISDLMSLVTRSTAKGLVAPALEHPPALEALGRSTVQVAAHSVGLLAFIGEIATSTAVRLIRPQRFRWTQILHELGEAGYKALGIVGLLTFLLGIVITYQGGVQLQQYGASVFVADLVGLSMLRELAPILTAIIVAGRTGSAYTAQIGTMQVTEEVDAMRVMGIQPLDMLVIPKVIALMIAMPLLTVYADIMGVLGGMVMANLQLDIAYTTFIDRLSEALTLDAYLAGIGKAPVFAAVIATLGCYQGFQVQGSAESVGRRTTISVVQSILAVIVIDAAFSVVFSMVGI